MRVKIDRKNARRLRTTQWIAATVFKVPKSCKWPPVGSLELHKTNGWGHVTACFWWLVLPPNEEGEHAWRRTWSAVRLTAHPGPGGAKKGTGLCIVTCYTQQLRDYLTICLTWTPVTKTNDAQATA